MSVAPNPRKTVVQFGSNYILELVAKPGVQFWTCPLAIDADGHPQAYHPKGSPPGLDYLANAGRPGNWWGIATDNGMSSGTPIIQSPSEPAPGFYVSTTALVDRARKNANPARYVNSGQVPYIVLPLRPKFHAAQTLGDMAMIFNNATGKSSWAIYADIGPTNQLGEGSMALAEALGVNSNPKTGGTPKETIAMIYWPGSSTGWPQTPGALAAQAASLFNEWGGFDSARIALPQINWDQFQSGAGIKNGLS